ncbi:hypothetical protein IIC65_02135, partial [Candidatus Sumerlaeota bacterium]|nr:hypothetical protein [Candidatus Sumerlaeota bacterium]
MIDWIADQTAWMYWTVPSAVAFAGLFIVLIAMTVWDRVSPSVSRKGFLPMETSRGDRLFIGILTMIAIFLVWLAFAGNSALWVPLAGAALAFALIG